MKNFLLISLFLFISNKAFASVQCITVYSGSGDYLVSQDACWYEWNEYGNDQPSVDAMYRLPNFSQLNIKVNMASMRYMACLTYADKLYTPCAVDRTDQLYVEYIACATLAAYGNPLTSTVAGALCLKTYNIDNEKTPAYCASVVTNTKNTCTFDI